MISDEQRREVAARMRDIMRRHPNCFLDNMVAQSVLDVLGDGLTIGETVADLIDRPTCQALEKDVTITSRDGAVSRTYTEICCSRCGRSPWADSDSVTPFCPECGAEVVE